MNESILPLFHHSIPLSQVRFGTIRADPAWSDAWLMPAYEWLLEQIGFFPHFVSVGRDSHALYRTGYQDNWRVWTGGEFIDGKYRKHYRKKGEFPNMVLLSFEELDGIFMDHATWHIAINACTNGHGVSDREMRMILKPSWTRSRWLRAATETHDVELLVPELPLDRASAVWVRNSTTRRQLEMMGFSHVTVARIKV